MGHYNETNSWENPEWVHYWGLDDYDVWDPFEGAEEDYPETYETDLDFSR